MIYVRPPRPPKPGVALEEYLLSVGAVKHWLPWSQLWEQEIGSTSELPQPERYGLVVDSAINYGGGEQVYALPIDLQRTTIIWEEFKGHRRALDKLADLGRAEESISFALLTVMISLSDSRGYSRPRLSRQLFSKFTLLLGALWAYFDVHHLWHHATRRYTFTGFSEPLLSYEEEHISLALDTDYLREWVLMRWHIWCSEVGIGYLVGTNEQAMSRYAGNGGNYPQDVLSQLGKHYRLAFCGLRPTLEPYDNV